MDMGPAWTVLVIATARWLSCSILALSGPGWLVTPATGSMAEHAPLAGDLQIETDLEEETGLTVTIDDLRPAALTQGEDLTVSGTVTNDGETHWQDAQVYLDIAADPATTRPELTTLADSDMVVGTRIIEIGMFAEIGAVGPEDAVSYSLTVPFDRLPISGIAGVYHVGVTVVAQDVDAIRVEVARTDMVMPFLPDRAAPLRPTKVTTLIPLIAPVLRQRDGDFLDDSLVGVLSTGGRLRNVLAFAAEAPPRSLHLVLDPALLDAVRAMADGYVVQTSAEAARGDQGRPGGGQREAADWLAALDEVAADQRLSVLPWGVPDASGLAAYGMPGVVEAAVLASRSYAARHDLNDAVLGWQTNGSTRRGLSVARSAGTSVQVVAEDSLTRLVQRESFPPAVVSLPTQSGPLTALVVRSDVGGEPLTADTPVIRLRQYLLAEATVRSLTDDPQARHAVFPVPFQWDPGLVGGDVDMQQAYTYPTVEPRTGFAVARREPTPYLGPVEATGSAPPLSTGVVSAIQSLRNKGRVFTGMLSDNKRATVDFNEQLGLAGSSAWRRLPKAGEAMIRQQTARLGKQIAKVTVTGPTFVALSSKSGPFPLTVTNGLKVPITVRLDVEPQNPALRIDPIDAVELEAGQRRDVQVTSRTDGSGLTQVRVRLSTPDDHLFGSPWNFNVRATQFGLVIWIAMGAGAAILFGAAIIRIYSRIRGWRASLGKEPAAS